MKFLVISLLTFTLFAGFQIEARTKQYTTKSLQSADVSETVIGEPGKLRESFEYSKANLIAQIFNIGSTRQPKEILLIWNKDRDKFRLAGKRQSFTGERFEKPVLFEVNEHRFLNISTEPTGSGGFVSDVILWLAPDGTLHEVEFEQASGIYETSAASDEVVMTGGEKEFFFEDNQMNFQFWLAQQGDPHCCPSGGVVQGTYKLEGSPKFDSFSRQYRPDFKIIIDNMQHSPESSAIQLHASKP